jgi:hypothetical protein
MLRYSKKLALIQKTGFNKDAHFHDSRAAVVSLVLWIGCMVRMDVICRLRARLGEAVLAGPCPDLLFKLNFFTYQVVTNVFTYICVCITGNDIFKCLQVGCFIHNIKNSSVRSPVSLHLLVVFLTSRNTY